MSTSKAASFLGPLPRPPGSARLCAKEFLQVNTGLPPRSPPLSLPFSLTLSLTRPPPLSLTPSLTHRPPLSLTPTRCAAPPSSPLHAAGGAPGRRGEDPTWPRSSVTLTSLYSSPRDSGGLCHQRSVPSMALLTGCALLLFAAVQMSQYWPWGGRMVQGHLPTTTRASTASPRPPLPRLLGKHTSRAHYILDSGDTARFVGKTATGPQASWGKRGAGKERSTLFWWENPCRPLGGGGI